MNGKKLLKNTAQTLAIISFWLALWTIAALAVDKELLLPSPLSVAKQLVNLCIAPYFWKAVGLTLFRISFGTLTALLVGTVLAIVTTRHHFLHRLLYPFITIIRSTPVASFIILAILWLGANVLPSFICFLMVLPIVWAAVGDGLRAIDPKLLEVCQCYRFSLAKKLRVLYIPSILPFFLSACKTSIGMAWKAGVAAEVLAVTRDSIGKQLYSTKLYLETPQLFAWTTVVILLSLVIEKITALLLGGLIGRRHDADRQKSL